MCRPPLSMDISVESFSAQPSKPRFNSKMAAAWIESILGVETKMAEVVSAYVLYQQDQSQNASSNCSSPKNVILHTILLNFAIYLNKL